ncbi:MAG: exodeoxyribonuclease VII small subunit [Candidatus Cloacimonetes bacterium]|nr:exodeoxyribonuclease VII small subunit [Candidatus Cloacimonadota bacterium]MDY0367529.1 exodeoxyribonuclease VII small subunit [Candidatus Syntrophosphaera sp.]
MNESNDSPLLSFEKSLRSLEATVERLQQEQLDLDLMVKLYEEGIEHLEACQKALEGAELRIRQLNTRIKAGENEGSENG